MKRIWQNKLLQIPRKTITRTAELGDVQAQAPEPKTVADLSRKLCPECFSFTGRLKNVILYFSDVTILYTDQGNIQFKKCREKRSIEIYFAL